MKPAHDLTTIPPPPRTPSRLEVMRDASGGWKVVAPGALILALVTAGSSAFAVRVAAPAQVQSPDDIRQDVRDIKRDVAELVKAQRELTDKVQRDTQAAENRDTIQDLKLESLKAKAHAAP